MIFMLYLYVVMKLNGPLTIGICFLSFTALMGCGGINTLLTGDGTYRVTALVGDQSVDSLALVRENDSLVPQFLSNIANDPDVRGLSVSILTPEGKPAGGTVTYTTGAGSAVGRSGETGSASVSLSGAEGDSKSGTQGASAPASLNTTVVVSRLDSRLPGFSLPVDLALGSYVLDFQVLGKDGVLSELKRPIFYLGSATWNVKALVSYPPGTGPSSQAPLFPPNVNLLLAVGLDADPRLNPYVRWYFGSTPIASGRVADGVSQILWKTRSPDGFYTIRAEVFPFPPADAGLPDTAGISKELTVAVSSKAPFPGLPPSGGPYSREYDFMGTLADASGSASLMPLGASTPEWRPSDTSYGLVVGGQNSYSYGEVPYPVTQTGVQLHRLTFHLAPLAPGLVARVSYAQEDGSAVVLALSVVAQGFACTLTKGGDGVTKIVECPLGNQLQWVSIDFSIQNNTATARLFLQNDPSSGQEVRLSPVGSCTGTGSFQFGASETKAPTSATPDESLPSGSSGVAILQGFGVSTPNP